MAKTKLAPKKTKKKQSVAKLELEAGLLGAHLANYVYDFLTHLIHEKTFRTNSFCVRNWVRSTAGFHKPFVSRTIGEIHTLAKPQE